MKLCKTILLFFISSFIICSTKNDKWIVITTIAHPTPAVQKLAALKDWNMVIVADKKTPEDWKLANCHFLSVEDQKKLPYKIITFLPFNHYVRKNIGYLYAIAHGAKIIYETDDDNILINDSISFISADSAVLHCSELKRTVNPYAYFGQPTVWPRGFPLSEILEKESFADVSKKTGCFLIQQGLANGDPDVDAIFRLTRGTVVTFDHDKEPLALPAHVFCPFNSQNTLFYYNAFWALVLPITKSFRVCDIWRGYWAQRLLWDIGAQLTFLAPSVFQDRNQHNLLHDFKDELELYCSTEALIEFLHSWRSSESLLENRIKSLTVGLINAGLLNQQELDFMNAWIEDLHSVGYIFPSCIQENNN